MKIIKEVNYEVKVRHEDGKVRCNFVEETIFYFEGDDAITLGEMLIRHGKLLLEEIEKKK